MKKFLTLCLRNISGEQRQPNRKTSKNEKQTKNYVIISKIWGLYTGGNIWSNKIYPVNQETHW